MNKNQEPGIGSQQLVEPGTGNLQRAGQPVNRSAASGFTLLELMVAFTILSLMAGVVFSSFRTVLRSYEISQQRLESEARKRVLQDLIKRQIGSLFPVRPSASFMDLQDADSRGQQLAAFSRTPLFYGSFDSVTFATVAPLMMQENPGLTIVRYGLAQDEFGNYFVGALEDRYMGLDSFMAMVYSPSGEPLPLIEEVVDLEFQYYGYDAQTESYEWFSSWIGEEMLAVPEAVKISYDQNHLIVPINASFSGTGLRQGAQRAIRR